MAGGGYLVGERSVSEGREFCMMAIDQSIMSLDLRIKVSPIEIVSTASSTAFSLSLSTGRDV